MDPHRFFGHRNSAYYFPPLNRPPDPYFPPREIDDRVYRVRHEPHYYLPPLPNPPPNREFIEVRRRPPPPPYVDANEPRIYRTVRRTSPPPSPPPAHHHHKSSRKKSKKSKKRSRSKGTRSSDYEDDSSHEFDKKNSREPENHSKFKSLSDEHDSFSDADFGSPISDTEKKEDEQSVSVNTVEVAREEVKPQNTNSQEAHKPSYQSYKLLQDPFIKPGCAKLYRYDGVVPNNPNYPAVQVRDPRLSVATKWSKKGICDLPVPQFKVSVSRIRSAYLSS